MASPPKKTPTDHPPSRGNPPGVETMLELARRVTAATSAPVVGGIAVLLHGGGRHTRDIDIYSTDFWVTHEQLEAAGIRWDSTAREHVIDGVGVHMVGDDSLGGPPKHVSTIKRVKVISLADLVRAKLTVGLTEVRRSKDITHVIDLIEQVPLDKSFAAKLPTKLRGPFKKLVEQVRGPRRTTIPTLRLWGLA
ncbi:MAG: hypothetical protein ACREJO_05795 [Phycisphaerales bacterium]